MRQTRLLATCFFFYLACACQNRTAHHIVFVGREPFAQPQAQGLNGTSSAQGDTDAAVETIYRNIEPLSSLLINDCGNFCNDPFFSYNRILQQAASVTELPAPDTYPKLLYDQLVLIPGASNHLRPYQAAEDNQFQLLAIVNRLDLAHSLDSNHWTGAELRFVYGAKQLAPKPDPEPFTLIIEFVLRDLGWKEFRAMSSDWDALRKHQPSELGSALKTLLQQAWSPVAQTKPGSASAIRIRTNSLTGKNTGPWSFSQWNLTANGIQRVNLDDEINRLCSSHQGADRFDSNVCPQVKPESCAAYLPMYDAIGPAAVAFKVTDPSLLVRTQCYAALDPGMDGPEGVCASDSTASPGGKMFRGRNILSLQQCSNCHGPETQNQDFTHIFNRQERKSVAELSRFLTGNKHLKPALADFEQRSPDAGFTAHVHVTWPGKQGCAPKVVEETRYYNDLTRRSLFLAAVLAADASKEPGPELLATIRNFGTDMAH